MEFSPVKYGLGTLWSLSMQGGKAHDFIRGASLASTLYKQSGHFSKGWEKRFFVLAPTLLLVYFDSPDDAEPRGIVVLNQDSAVEQVDSMAGRGNVLNIRPMPTAADGRVLHVSAETPDEAREWCEALFKNRADVLKMEKATADMAKDAAMEAAADATARASAERSAFDAEIATHKAEVEALTNALASATTQLSETAVTLRGVVSTTAAADLRLRGIEGLTGATSTPATGMRAALSAATSPSDPVSASAHATASASGVASGVVSEAVSRNVAALATSLDALRAAARDVASLTSQVAASSNAVSHAHATASTTLATQAALLESERVASAARESGWHELESAYRDKEAAWKERENKIAVLVQQVNVKLTTEKERNKVLATEVRALRERVATAEQHAQAAEEQSKVATAKARAAVEAAKATATAALAAAASAEQSRAVAQRAADAAHARERDLDVGSGASHAASKQAALATAVVEVGAPVSQSNHDTSAEPGTGAAGGMQAAATDAIKDTTKDAAFVPTPTPSPPPPNLTASDSNGSTSSTARGSVLDVTSAVGTRADVKENTVEKQQAVEDAEEDTHDDDDVLAELNSLVASTASNTSDSTTTPQTTATATPPSVSQPKPGYASTVTPVLSASLVPAHLRSPLLGISGTTAPSNTSGSSSGGGLLFPDERSTSAAQSTTPSTSTADGRRGSMLGYFNRKLPQAAATLASVATSIAPLVSPMAAAPAAGSSSSGLSSPVGSYPNAPMSVHMIPPPAGPASPPGFHTTNATGGGVESSELNILADPHPGRLYVLVMGARHLPEAVFGSFGTKSAYVKVKAMDGEKAGKPVEAVDKGRGRGLCSTFHQVTPFRVTHPIDTSRIQLDVFAHRSFRGDVRIGGACLDCGPLEDWPAQPHAVWLLLHACESKGSEPDPAEILVPVTPNIVASAVNLPPGEGGSGSTASTSTAAVIESTDPTKYAMPELPPPPIEDTPCILVQLVYLPHGDEPLQFHLPATLGGSDEASPALTTTHAAGATGSAHSTTAPNTGTASGAAGSSGGGGSRASAVGPSRSFAAGAQATTSAATTTTIPASATGGSGGAIGASAFPSPLAATTKSITHTGSTVSSTPDSYLHTPPNGSSVMFPAPGLDAATLPSSRGASSGSFSGSSTAATVPAAGSADMALAAIDIAKLRSQLERLARAYKELQKEKLASEVRIAELTVECDKLKAALSKVLKAQQAKGVVAAAVPTPGEPLA